jgi:hypothetical protein
MCSLEGRRIEVAHVASLLLVRLNRAIVLAYVAGSDMASFSKRSGFPRAD